jgi:hypothetical protein
MLDGGIRRDERDARSQMLDDKLRGPYGVMLITRGAPGPVVRTMKPTPPLPRPVGAVVDHRQRKSVSDPGTWKVKS